MMAILGRGLRWIFSCFDESYWWKVFLVSGGSSADVIERGMIASPSNGGGRDVEGDNVDGRVWYGT